MTYFIKTHNIQITIVILSLLSFTVQARDSLTALRADLAALQAQVDALHQAPAISYEIGDRGPAGGIVFYVTNGGENGLEAAPEDQSSASEWGCREDEISGADGIAVGTGVQNTIDILTGCQQLGIAAEIVNFYSQNGFDDWFLPSQEELNLLYVQRNVVGSFFDQGAFDGYWSSTESESEPGRAIIKFFPSGAEFSVNKSINLRVRAIRAF